MKIKIEKSKYPEENKTHIVVKYTATKYGLSSGRIFKGSYKECLDFKRNLENEKKER